MAIEQKSILIADNDNNILDALSKQFKKMDMLVISAQDGYDAYNRACKESPDYLIAEVSIPLINGYRLSRLIKGDERYSSTPVILMTNKKAEKNEEMLKSCGADDIIQKPFRFQNLVSLIDAMGAE
tara:strand:- start:141 stop:518 length:378 start_codon:yes stop_codon:yes gene_type:complete